MKELSGCVVIDLLQPKFAFSLQNISAVPINLIFVILLPLSSVQINFYFFLAQVNPMISVMVIDLYSSKQYTSIYLLA